MLLNEKTRMGLGAAFLGAGIAGAHWGQHLPFYGPALLCAGAIIAAGYPVLLNAIKNIFRGAVLDENFLMSAAAIAAFVIGEYPEAAAVMLFYQIGEYFQDYAVDKSRTSIAALRSLRPDRALVVRQGQRLEVSPEAVAVGECIEVKPGERSPLDGVVIQGASFVDTSALTGESVPREVFAGSEVLAGSVNTTGLLLIQVTRPAGDSAVARILALVQEAGNKKAKTERFITRFAKVYTPVVTASAFLLAVIPPLVLGGGWSEWVHRGVIFLVVSCPCALVISVPLGFFGGIGAASRSGILIKGGNYLELLARTSVVVFDKTGTLTKGVFNVSAVHPAQEGQAKADLLALAAHAEQFSCHPISCSLRAAHSGSCCDCVHLADPQEISGKGVSVTLDGQPVLAGNAALLRGAGIPGIAEECAASDGGTVVHVASGGSYSGHIVISDELKEDARQAIRDLKAVGVKKTVLLTGDASAAGTRAAIDLGIDEVYTELLPGDKVAQVERLLAEESQREGKHRGTLVFLGDGINDAPVLARSDVGVAMGGLGSDAAIEAADAVIMSDEPSRLAAGIKIARKTLGIVKENILFSLGIKGAVLVLGAAGYASMWLAVFADVGVTFLAVLNSLRLLKYRGIDRQIAAHSGDGDGRHGGAGFPVPR